MLIPGEELINFINPEFLIS